MGFFGIEMGKTALQAQQTALDVVGHNISNANTDGYSRQNVKISSMTMEDNKFGTKGIGAKATSIDRVRDSFLDDRIIEELQTQSKWETKETNLKQIQYILNEPSDESIRFILDEFWSSLHDLSQNPEDSSTRISVRERAVDLSNTINGTYENLLKLKRNVNNEMRIEMNDINTKLEQVADLNDQISKVEIGTSKANDLRDKRDKLTEELSQSINIDVSRKERTYNISIGGRTAVQGSTFTGIKAERSSSVNEGMYQFKWKDTNQPLYIKDGKMQGLQEIRDININQYTDYLDQLAIGLTDRLNEVQESGFDINGQKGINFFDELKVYDETFDIDNDGVLEAAIYKLKGSTVVDNVNEEPLANDSAISDSSGHFEVNGMRVNYNTSEDSLSELIEKINDLNSGVVAAADPYNRLTLRATKETDYTLRSVTDSGGNLLEELGVLQGGNFEFQEASTLNNISEDRMARPESRAALNMGVKIKDINKIAAAKGVDTDGDEIPDKANNVGDGSNALDLAGLKQEKAIGEYTYSDYFESLISDLGISAQQSKRFVQNEETLINNLNNQREAKIGVSLDEEMTNMMKYQHGYSAISKYINTRSEMIDTLINRL
ncbi:MAG: flagellar hook-associated protein FlgK [Fusobacteriota bacterium]